MVLNSASICTVMMHRALQYNGVCTRSLFVSLHACMCESLEMSVQGLGAGGVGGGIGALGRWLPVG